MKFLLASLALLSTSALAVSECTIGKERALAVSECTIGKERFELAERFGISKMEMQPDGGIFLNLYGMRYTTINFPITEITFYNDRVIIHRLPIVGSKVIPLDLDGTEKIHCRPK